MKTDEFKAIMRPYVVELLSQKEIDKIPASLISQYFNEIFSSCQTPEDCINAAIELFLLEQHYFI